jgi:CBS domain-containing protein
MKVGGVMTRQIEIAAPDETLQKAASRMAELDTGVLPVGEGNQIELVNLAALIDDAKCF